MDAGSLHDQQCSREKSVPGWAVRSQFSAVRTALRHGRWWVRPSHGAVCLFAPVWASGLSCPLGVLFVSGNTRNVKTIGQWDPIVQIRVMTTPQTSAGVADLGCGLDVPKFIRVNVETVKMSKDIDKPVRSQPRRRGQTLMSLGVRPIMLPLIHPPGSKGPESRQRCHRESCASGERSASLGSG